MRYWINLVETSLFENQIPYTDYGYWITDTGKFYPVPYEGHSEAARVHGTTYGHALETGWIRIIDESRVAMKQLDIEYHGGQIGRAAISSLQRLLNSNNYHDFKVDIRGRFNLHASYTEATAVMRMVHATSKKAVERYNNDDWKWATSGGYFTKNLTEARRGLAPIGEMRAKVFWQPRHSDLMKMLDNSKIGDLRGSWIRTSEGNLIAIWPARSLGHWNFHNECYQRGGIEFEEKIDFRVGRDYSVLSDERYWSNTQHYKGEGFYCAFYGNDGFSINPNAVSELAALFGRLEPVKNINEKTGLLESDDIGMDRARALVKKYGGVPKPYDMLPNGAKKAITHWMTIDGDNEDYEEEFLYAYAEIPVEEFMNAYWQNIIDIHDPSLAQDYPTPKHMLDNYRSRHPSKSFGSYNFKKHDLTEPWAVILGSEFFMDGAHRLALYVHSGMEKIPVVITYDND